MTTRIRGIRTSIKAGSLTGRLPSRGGPGPAQEVSLSDLGAALVATGQFGLPGAGSGTGLITSVDSNFTVTGGGQLQLHTIASGDLLANSGAGIAEPTGVTPTAWMDRAFGTTSASFVIRGAATWNAQILSGDVTMTGSGVVTIVDDAVTYAKMQDGGSNGLLGIVSGGEPVEVTIGTGLSLAGNILSASGGSAFGPLVTGETPGPIPIATVDGQFIMVPLT